MKKIKHKLSAVAVIASAMNFRSQWYKKRLQCYSPIGDQPSDSVSGKWEQKPLLTSGTSHSGIGASNDNWVETIEFPQCATATVPQGHLKLLSEDSNTCAATYVS